MIEAAKQGRLDQMPFFSALLTTRAPPTTVRRPSDDRPPAVRQPSTVGALHFELISNASIRRLYLSQGNRKQTTHPRTNNALNATAIEPRNQDQTSQPRSNTPA
ncbi:MAG: hypothetical protein VX228_16985, partial [Pseudomonadota bacterium]|nr:hypothetical protein [Pseudomonadota bacterium]